MGVTLIKKYRIVHSKKNMIMHLEEMPKEIVTYVGKNLSSFETDDKTEAEKYINNNKLEYTEL